MKEIWTPKIGLRIKTKVYCKLDGWFQKKLFSKSHLQKTIDKKDHISATLIDKFVKQKIIVME